MGLTDPLEIAFINKWQSGVPVCKNPYSVIAAEMGIAENRLFAIIEKLLKEGMLSRFGPLYDAKQMGGGLTLAAISVPENEFEKVTGIVNDFVEVAHNYRREHTLNMWFVVATETEQAVLEVIHNIQLKTGLKVFNCPKLQEFYVGLKLYIDKYGQVDTVPMDISSARVNEVSAGPVLPNSFEREIIEATQAGLVLEAEPYEYLARELSCDTERIIQAINIMLKSGVMRRIGAVPNHYKLGLRGNGMTVWDVPDEMVNKVGELIGSMDFVSHCYERPRHKPDWPYNLFAMIHGSDREQVKQKLAIMEEALYPGQFQHQVLFSTAVLKKTGLRLVKPVERGNYV